MSLNEKIAESKIYRVLTDAASQAFDRVSFWTTAKSVKFNKGSNTTPVYDDNDSDAGENLQKYYDVLKNVYGSYGKLLSDVSSLNDAVPGLVTTEMLETAQQQLLNGAVKSQITSDINAAKSVIDAALAEKAKASDLSSLQGLYDTLTGNVSGLTKRINEATTWNGQVVNLENALTNIGGIATRMWRFGSFNTYPLYVFHVENLGTISNYFVDYNNGNPNDGYENFKASTFLNYIFQTVDATDAGAVLPEATVYVNGTDSTGGTKALDSTQSMMFMISGWNNENIGMLAAFGTVSYNKDNSGNAKYGPGNIWAMIGSRTYHGTRNKSSRSWNLYSLDGTKSD